MTMMQTPTTRVVMMMVITISNGDDADTDSELGDDGGDRISNSGDADTDRELGGDGGDHYQQ